MRIPALCLTLLAAAAFPSAAQGVSTTAGSDRLVAGGSVRQSQPVTGDLFGFAGDFELSAPVEGDAIMAGGNVRVAAPVGGDLIVAGGNVTISANVARNAIIGAGNVEVSPDAEIGQDLTAGAGDIDIRGPVRGSVYVGAGDVFIDAQIGGDVNAGTAKLRLGPNARVAGRVLHRGGAVIRDEGAEVAGGIQRAKGDRPRASADRHVRLSGGGWFWTAGVLALAALLAGAFPAASKRLGGELGAHPGLALLFGFVTLVCVPIAALVFMITIIGIPVAIVVLLLYFLLLLVGYAFAGVMLGELALRKWRAQDAAHAGWRIGAAVAAMLAIALVGRVPFLGNLVVFLAILAGLGAIVITVTRKPAAAAV